VVLEYYDAINAHDYQTAWALGGRNLSSNYAAYVQGYAGTASVTVSILSTQGNTVSVSLVAMENNGSEATYQGTYTVQNGVITGANIQSRFCNLNLTEGQGMGATGHYTLTLIYTNAGQTTCMVHGYASLQFFNSSGQVAATVNQGSSFFQMFDVTPPSFSLAPGQSASFDIGGADFNNDTQTPCPAADVIVTEPPVTPGTQNNVQIALPTPPGTPVCSAMIDESPVVPGSNGP
jgi:hypothetical protein